MAEGTKRAVGWFSNGGENNLTTVTMIATPLSQGGIEIVGDGQFCPTDIPGFVGDFGDFDYNSFKSKAKSTLSVDEIAEAWERKFGYLDKHAGHSGGGSVF